ncbi:MAG: HigA family addiction module antitoxin [Mariprofundaceae bacterium]
MPVVTITNGLRPIHPGEILRDEFLAPLEMSAHALSIHLRVPAPRINDLVRERRGVSVDTALRLARYFNNTPKFWLNLQTVCDVKVAKANKAAEIEHSITPIAA